MKPFLQSKSVRAVLLLAAILAVGPVLAEPGPLPKVFYADPEAMAEARAKLAAGDASLKPAFEHLVEDARKALDAKPISVMEKHKYPPSGDKHDYISQAPYFWRDS